MLSDDELVRCIRSGDRESYGLLAARHHERLHRIARKYVRTPTEAEDALQGAHLLALLHFDQYEGRSTYVNWMTTITINLIHSGFRHNRVQAGCEEFRDCYPAAISDPEQLAIKGDFRRIVRSALQRIPPMYSLVLWMRDLDELTTEERPAGGSG